MTLTDKQKIKLRKEIETVLSSEDKLKSIFLEHPETFEANFYNKISGDNYSSRITNVLIELEKKDKLESFIDIVSKDYPLIKERYQIYSQLSLLISLLKKILSENQNFGIFFGGFENIDKLEEHLLELTEETEKNDNSLLSSERDSFSFYYYLDFIDFVGKYLVEILNAEDIRNYLQRKLRKWIETNCSNIDIPEEQKTNSSDINIPDKQDKSSDLQSYLLITIFPMGGQTKNNKKTFNIQGELIENWGDTKNIKVELKKEDFEENGYSETQIPNIIYKFIERVQEAHLHNQVHKQSKTYDLKLELFLNKELFIKDFEFKIPNALKAKQKAICEEYPVILRSLERLQADKTSWLNCCTKNWKIMEKKPVISNNILAFKLEDKLNEFLSNPQKRKQLGNKLEDKIILKISCGLPKGTKAFHLFEIILEKGVPLCLWIKRKNPRDKLNDSHYQSLIDKLNHLIELETLLDVNQLYTQIFDIRKTDLALADSYKKESLGYHLRILCDCNERKPINIPAFNQLITNS